MTDKTDDNENIDDVDAPGEAEETKNLSLEDAEDELDHDALAKLAEESVSGADPDDMDEADVEARDEGVVATKDDTDENKDAAADEGAATADKGGDTKDEKPDAKPDEGLKVDGVLTKDGKHFMPYAVVEGLRERSQTAETKAQQLERENAELKERIEKGAPADTSEDGVKLSDEQQSSLDAINAQIGKIEEEYGEELSAPLKASLEMQKNALLDNARLRQELETARQAPKDTGNDDEAKAVQAAIDSSPVMATWQARGDDWYKRSVEVYNTAMANDPDFAALSREEQFKELPNRVQALYGKDKTLVGEAKPDEKPAAKPKDDKPADKAATDFKGTISDIPGGTPPDSAKYGPVDGMSPQAIQAYMDEQAEKGTLEDYANAIA